MTKRQKAIAYLMNKPHARSYQHHNLLIIQYDELCTAIFEPKCVRPTWHYKHRTQQEQVEFIEQRKKFEDSEHARRQEYAREAQEKAESIKVGSILCSSWGYEQTNIDFYKVVERKNNTIKLVEIEQVKTYSGDMQGNCTPEPSQTKGEPFTKRINKFGGVNLASYKYCSLWDGRPMSWSSYN